MLYYYNWRQKTGISLIGFLPGKDGMYDTLSGYDNVQSQ